MTEHRLYKWQAINQHACLEDGYSLAVEKKAVSAYIIQRGLQPLSIKSCRRITKSYWCAGGHLITITRQLAILLQSGLPLVNSLQLLAKEMDMPAWRCLLKEISQKVTQGQPFSEVIRSYPQAFPVLYCQLIAVGELTGNLDQCCLRLAQQQEQQQQLQKKVTKALRYPLFICSVALLVSIIMLAVVLPQFAQIYVSFNADLPLLTNLLLSLSALLVKYGAYIAVSLTIICVGYFKILRKKSQWQKREQRFLLSIPFFSALIRKNCLSQIFQTLAITQHAGLTLDSGLKAASLSMNNIFYQQAITYINTQIEQGTPLYYAISRCNDLFRYPLFPQLCQQVIRVGEESGALDILLEKLATWHQQQAQEQAENLTQLLEPTLMLVVGIIIGTLVIAMYLPVFQLGNIIG